MVNKIQELIKDSLLEVKDLINSKNIKSRIIFPLYSDDSDDKNRYSEQELKIVFLNKIEASKFYYSVETPSKYAYRFKDNLPKVLFENESTTEKYQSSMIDVSVYDEKKQIISHIEFKHGQCPEFPIRKDFLKLICESDKSHRNFFVHYLEKSNEQTRKAIFDKYQKSLEHIKIFNSNISCFEEKLNNTFVYVAFIGLNKLYKCSLKDIDNIEKFEEEL